MTGKDFQTEREDRKDRQGENKNRDVKRKIGQETNKRKVREGRRKEGGASERDRKNRNTGQICKTEDSQKKKGEKRNGKGGKIEKTKQHR